MRSSSLARTSLTLAIAAFALVTSTREARAGTVNAIPCDADPYYCATGALAFDRKDSVPIEWSFDTGWTPQNSPLQVHLWAGVYASTRVALVGALQTSWPEVLVLKTPGAPGGGLLSFHYGVELRAQAKIRIEVAGQKYEWTGDVPYVPQTDFQVEGEQPFDAWGYSPGATLSSKTKPQKIIQVGIKDIVGGSIPGIDGGLEVDVAMELAATYVNRRMVLKTPEGEPVVGGDIEAAEGESKHAYTSGPAVDLDVHPEGTVDYDGTIHLIPAFYVTLLGKKWQIPVADIPMDFPITQTQWIFDAQRVHVPLPDVVLPKMEIDFGEVEVGQKKLESFSLWNAGEGKAQLAIVSSSPDLFPPWDPSLEIEPGITADSAVRFMPLKNGAFTATLYVASNDPNDPVQELVLRGVGFGGPPEPPAEVSEESGCACRAAGQGGAGAPALILAATSMAGGVFRRRRRRAGGGREVSRRRK